MPPLKEGRSPSSSLLRLCSGSGSLSAVSAFCDSGALSAVSDVSSHGGVVARGPAWPYSASLLAFCVLLVCRTCFMSFLNLMQRILRTLCERSGLSTGVCYIYMCINICIYIKPGDPGDHGTILADGIHMNRHASFICFLSSNPNLINDPGT